MPTALPPLGLAYGTKVEQCLDLVRAIEISVISPGHSSGVKWTPVKLHLAYEASFLRLFTEWEMFLEECTVRLMRGYVTPSYLPVFPPGVTSFRDIANARQALFGPRNYLMWYDPKENASRVRKWLVSSPIEIVCSSAQSWLEYIATIRHRIAHRSEDARIKFDNSSMALTSRRFPASSAGRMLRAPNPTSGYRNIEDIASTLRKLALQVAP